MIILNIKSLIFVDTKLSGKAQKLYEYSIVSLLSLQLNFCSFVGDYVVEFLYPTVSHT